MPHPFLAFWIYAAKFVSLLYQQQQRDAMGLVNYMVMDTLLLSVTSSAFSAATMLSPISIASPAIGTGSKVMNEFSQRFPQLGLKSCLATLRGLLLQAL